jgi:hypothetical protein
LLAEVDDMVVDDIIIVVVATAAVLRLPSSWPFQ